MKVFSTIVKIGVAVAAVAGAVYAAATYGDKIVAWAKNLLSRCKCGGKCCCKNASEPEEEPVETVETAEEAVEEAESVEPTEEEAESSEQVESDENTVTADEADFEG